MTATVTAQEIIGLISKAVTYLDVFPDMVNWKSDFKQMAQTIHPDKCKEAGVADAITKLNKFKDQIEKGTNFLDDAGPANYNYTLITSRGELPLLKASYNNYNSIMATKGTDAEFFKKYAPRTASLSVDALEMTLPKRYIPLTAIHKHFDGKVPHMHTNWIINRVLEFICFLTTNNMVHCGINPESIFICPQDHDMICASFYHLKPIGSRLSTVSAKYANFYPGYIFSNNEHMKHATPRLDLECATRLAVWLLGDSSCIGSNLRKTHIAELLDFYSSIHENASEAYFKHREIVAKHFKKEFIPLNI